MKRVALISLVFLAGCTSGTAVFRVIEYGTGLIGSEVGGCAVHRTPQAPGSAAEQIEFLYKGEKCAVRAVTR